MAAGGRSIEAEVRRDANDRTNRQHRATAADAEDSSSEDDEEENDNGVDEAAETTALRRPRLFINPQARENLTDETLHGERALVERELNEDALDFDVELPYNKLPVRSNYRSFFLKLHGLYEHKREQL